MPNFILAFPVFRAGGRHLPTRTLPILLVAAHEFGHCLGIGHVSDAADFYAKATPPEDIMSYQFTPEQVHCVSNLNLRAMEGSFAELLGRPQSEWLGFTDYVHVAPDDYVQVPCANP